MKLIKFLIVILIFISMDNLYSSDEFRIDWINGRIYSSEMAQFKNDYNFAYNRLESTKELKEKAKFNFYKVLDSINIDESTSLLHYFEERTDKNRELFSLIDNAKLYKIEYPKHNTIRLSYYIDIYGENSLMSLLMTERDTFTEDLKSYMGYYYDTRYSGVIIDARGELTSFDGYKVKVKPSLFIVIRDSDGRIVLDKNNIYPEVIKKKGMARYSYDINQDFTNLVGKNPYKIVAVGTGDRSGSHLVISVGSAKKMLSGDMTKKALQDGKIVIVIDP
ncbi:MAG: hypothetical protein JXB50_01880 [Spirochaetes bacterium]|nr:hypothetical protein [Spirochaetota bacterium]